MSSLCQCRYCNHWDQDKILSFDAGQVSVCKHKLIDGYQSLSSSGMRFSDIPKVIVDNDSHVEKPQTIYTRYNFGCVLWESN
jgi:hypothetical protein